MGEENGHNKPRAYESGDSSTKVRLRGLLLIVVGACMTPVFFIMAYYLGLLLASLFGDRGPIKIAVGIVAVPVVTCFIGWLEFVTGVSFRRLQEVFDRGGRAKFGLSLLIIVSGAAFVVLFVYAYNLASEQGWL